MQNDKNNDKETSLTITDVEKHITHEEKDFNIKHRKAKVDKKFAKIMKNWEGMSMSTLFMLPFLIMTSLNVKTAFVLIIVLSIVMIPVAMLKFVLSEKMNITEWVTAAFCVVVSMGIITLIAIVLRAYFPDVSGTVGKYLYLLSAYPLIYSVFEKKSLSKISIVTMRCLRNLVYFAVLMLITSAIREIFGNNQIFTYKIPIRIKVSSITLPFFGFMLVAFIIAFISRFVTYRLKKRMTVVVDEESA